MGNGMIAASISSDALPTSDEPIVRDSSNEFDSDDYDGSITFYLWLHGSWTPVLIDDRLPYLNYDSGGGRLLFSSGTDPDEFWLPLLEKAFAKVYGSYEALEGAQEIDVLVELTGGIAMKSQLGEILSSSDSNAERDFFKRNYMWFLHGALLICHRDRGGKRIENGLIDKCSYTVTNMAYVSTRGSKEPFRLLRIKAPWNTSMEWDGRWRDTDEQSWSMVSDETKARIGYEKHPTDGEFWMCCSDFCEEFSAITISLEPGEWKGKSAAGYKFKENKIFPCFGNPQFLLTVTEADDDDEEGNSTLMIGLMQKRRKDNIVKYFNAAFYVYKLKAKSAQCPFGSTFTMGCGSSAEVVPPDAKDNLEEDPEDGLFKDSDFPADISAICYSEDGRKKYEALKIVWKRPPELRESPCLMVEGVCSTDIVQGELGDCWFLSACAAVARESSIVTAVFREHAADPHACKNSSGILGLQFWRYGTWEPVTIDDRLPCIVNEDGKTYKLLFARCGNPDEFWLPMIEKAYAKYFGLLCWCLISASHQVLGRCGVQDGAFVCSNVCDEDVLDSEAFRFGVDFVGRVLDLNCVRFYGLSSVRLYARTRCVGKITPAIRRVVSPWELCGGAADKDPAEVFRTRTSTLLTGTMTVSGTLPGQKVEVSTT
ncbi:unnamed protein product, partial [Notodromas monacha]